MKQVNDFIFKAMMSDLECSSKWSTLNKVKREHLKNKYKHLFGEYHQESYISYLLFLLKCEPEEPIVTRQDYLSETDVLKTSEFDRVFHCKTDKHRIPIE